MHFNQFPLLSSSSGLCDNIIQDIICTYLVLPNRISIPLVGESQLAQLRFPVPKVTPDTLLLLTFNPVMVGITPLSLSHLGGGSVDLDPRGLYSLCLCGISQGVLRIHFLEAQDLLGKDKFLGGLIKGKSDPYGVLRFGTELFQSKVIHETVNPKWNEVYEVGLQEV